MFLRSLKVVGNSISRYIVYDFLLVFHCKFVSIFYRFRVMGPKKIFYTGNCGLLCGSRFLVPFTYITLITDNACHFAGGHAQRSCVAATAHLPVCGMTPRPLQLS